MKTVVVEDKNEEDFVIEIKEHDEAENNSSVQIPTREEQVGAGSKRPTSIAASNDVKMQTRLRWQKIAEKCLTSKPMTTEVETKDDGSEAFRSPFLNEGEGHFVWKPRTSCVHQRLATIVDQVMAMPLTLSERRKNLENRVQATRVVLRSSSKKELEIASATSIGHHMTFKDAARRVKEQMHPNGHYHFHDVVSRYMRAVHRKNKRSPTPQSIDVQVKDISSSPSSGQPSPVQPVKKISLVTENHEVIQLKSNVTDHKCDNKIPTLQDIAVSKRCDTDNMSKQDITLDVFIASSTSQDGNTCSAKCSESESHPKYPLLSNPAMAETMCI